MRDEYLINHEHDYDIPITTIEMVEINGDTQKICNRLDDIKEEIYDLLEIRKDERRKLESPSGDYYQYEKAEADITSLENAIEELETFYNTLFQIGSVKEDLAFSRRNTA